MTGLLAWLTLAWGAAPEPAGDAGASLRADLAKHAQRNSWPAVEDTYERLLAVGGLAAADHLLGAQAALELGHPLKAWHRLQRMAPPGPGADEAAGAVQAEGDALIYALQERYGLVSLFVPRGEDPALVRPHLPFARVERSAIDAAAASVQSERAFRGLLPEGDYELGGQAFVVTPGWAAWQVVVVGTEATTVPRGPAPKAVAEEGSSSGDDPAPADEAAIESPAAPDHATGDGAPELPPPGSPSAADATVAPGGSRRP